jgi:hypothetical protein
VSRWQTILVSGLIAVAVSAAATFLLTWRGAAAWPGMVLADTGLAEIPETPGRRVNSPAELDDLLHDRSFSGRVIIPRDVVWNMERCDRERDELGRFVCTPVLEIPLYSGVQLVGERGDLGSRPLLFTTILATTQRRALFEVCGNDVLVQGLHLRGPQPGDDHATKHEYVTAIRVHQNVEPMTLSQCAADRSPERRGPIGHRIAIIDNEFDQWTGGAVTPIGGHHNIPLHEWAPFTCPGNPVCCDTPADGEVCWQPLTPADAGLVRVERNFMHHNARDEGGYGVDLNGGAFVTITGNVFNYNRHAVASTGRAHSGYVARFNYVLQGGYREGGFFSYYNQHFDVHGEEPDGYGGAGGTYFEIAFNTIRGDQGYYVVQTRPALMMRGIPTVGMDFMNNVVVHSSLGKAVMFKGIGFQDGLSGLMSEKFRYGGNRFDTDYASDLAAGDFDGDGRTDIFLANGTAWFFSRAGKRPWEFLHASTKRLEELGFADVDNDTVTDVLYRDPGGNVGYLKSGRYPLAPLTTIPVPMKELRAGDFDGDGKTDLFFTRDGVWNVWYGSTRIWNTTQSSSKKVSELLFGEFDEVTGTDVATVLESGWVFSSGSTHTWAPLNSKLTNSFTDAVAADFDGNGKTDIAFRKGIWRLSADGRGPMTDLNAGPIRLNRWIMGHFEAGAPAMAIGWGPPFSSTAKRFVIWRGPASGKTLHPWSEHEMQ